MSHSADQCQVPIQVRAPAPEIKDLTDEQWREYEWVYTERGVSSIRVVRIELPQGLVLGNTTHRIIDAWGTVHCVPAVGLMGCVLRWRVKEGRPFVAF